MPSSDQGINRERYMLIPRMLIFLRRGESVLLLKGAPTKRLWAGKYNGVGGHVERGEDILSAARKVPSWMNQLSGDFLPISGEGRGMRARNVGYINTSATGLERTSSNNSID